MSFLAELKRRNVFRVGIAYVLMGWVLLQGADFALDLIGAPNWVIQVFALAVAIGLPIALFLAWAFEMTPEGIKREADVDRSQSITPKTGRKLDYAIIMALVVVIVVLGVERFYFARPAEQPLPADQSSQTSASDTSPGGEGQRAAPGVPEKSIAVLPFADMSQSQDQGWFADGLAEEILNALVRVPDLSVASRTSSFQYKGRNADISTIAGELGVAHVLEGSIRNSSDRIRVTAQLIRASDGFHLWSKSYDRDVSDMIKLQEDLARNIATTLETSMDPEALERMAMAGTRSIEAYQEYLRGLTLRTDAFVAAGGQEVFHQAYQHFERARTIDPGFADAHVQAADFWKVELSPSRTDTGSTSLAPLEKLREYHARISLAIQTARTEADRIRSLADQAAVDLRFNEARDLFRKYLDLRPNDEPARLELSSVAEAIGDVKTKREILAHWKVKGEVDRYSATIYVNDAYRTLEPAEAADQAMKFMRRWPNSAGLMYQAHRTLIWAGRLKDATELAARYKTLVPEGNALVDAREACANGDRQAAEQILDRMSDAPDANASELWLLHNMLGNTEKETEVLRQFEDTGVPYQLASFLSYHKFDPRPFPGLMAVLEREGVKRPPPVVPPFRCPPPD